MEGVDLVEKNIEVKSNEGNKECESFSNDVIFEDLKEEKGLENNSISSVLDSSSPPHSMDSPNKEVSATDSTSSHGSEVEEKKDLSCENFVKQVSVSPVLEIEIMKDRFAKLLLGEDMSGCGNGVPTSLAVSNAITNLCATLFGQLWRLEPLPLEKKAMWQREMEWLLCVSDHIVEFKPTWQTFPDGSKFEEILESFVHTEFMYVDQGVMAPERDGSTSFQRSVTRQEEKWWLPVPQVPPSGLHENSRKQLQHKRDCSNQISKAAMAINSITLAEMKVPDTYLESLPKTARASLGDVIYKFITSDDFSPESLLSSLDISSEHQAIEIANRVEASIYIWHKKTNSKPLNRAKRSSSRSSWEMFKDLIVEGDKSEMLIERAESLLLSLKQSYPFLPQTTLDVTKIQCNKDVGKSILESYSRVLESLASNIVARIDDVLYVDDLTKHSDQFSSISKVGVTKTHKSIPLPYKSPFINSTNISLGGVGMNKVVTNFVTVGKKEDYGCPIENLVPILNKFDEAPALETDKESRDNIEDFKLNLMDQAWIE